MMTRTYKRNRLQICSSSLYLFSHTKYVLQCKCHTQGMARDLVIFYLYHPPQHSLTHSLSLSVSCHHRLAGWLGPFIFWGFFQIIPPCVFCWRVFENNFFFDEQARERCPRRVKFSVNRPWIIYLYDIQS